jgi:hypothetical protein
VGGHPLPPEGKPFNYQKSLVDYDLSKAKVHEPVVRRAGEGAPSGHVEVVYRVELPAKVIDKPSLWIRVRMRCRDVGAAFRERLLKASPDWVQKRFGKPPADDKALLDATTGLKQDALDALKADLREHGLEVEVEVGGEGSIFDKYFAGSQDTPNDPAATPRARDAAG